MLAETRAEVGTADHKASLVLAGLGIGFGAVLGGLLAGDWSPGRLDGAALALWWLGAISAMASVALAGSAVWPRFDTSDADQGIFYWGHCTRFETFQTWAAQLDTQEYSLRDRNRHQLWALAHIVYAKYLRVRWALGLAAAATILFLAAAAL